MKAQTLLISIILGIIFTSCGIQKQHADNTSDVSYTSVTENGLVQTTFFGAKFGDEGQQQVKTIMSSHYCPVKVD